MFKLPNHKHETTINSYIWKLKEQNTNFNISWKYIAKAAPYNPSSGLCNLCDKEKYYIIMKPHLAELNKRNELTSNCRHRAAKLLSGVKQKTWVLTKPTFTHRNIFKIWAFYNSGNLFILCSNILFSFHRLHFKHLEEIHLRQFMRGKLGNVRLEILD